MCPIGVSTSRKLILRLGREVRATKDGQGVDNELFPLPSLSMLDLLVPRSMFADPKSGEASGYGENEGIW
jgi:hypothetical protein